jgi:hypothetical protein
MEFIMGISNWFLDLVIVAGMAWACWDGFLATSSWQKINDELLRCADERVKRAISQKKKAAAKAVAAEAEYYRLLREALAVTPAERLAKDLADVYGERILARHVAEFTGVDEGAAGDLLIKLTSEGWAFPTSDYKDNLYPVESGRYWELVL